MAISFDIVEHEYSPSARRQCRYRPFEVNSGLGVFRERDPDVTGSIGWCSDLFVDLIIRQHYPRSPSTVCSRLDEHLVHRNPVEPRGQLGVPAEGPQSVPGADEYTLGDFARARSIRRHAQAERVNTPDLSSVNVLERLDVAGPGALDKPRVVFALRAPVRGWDRGHGIGRVLPGEVRRHPGSRMPPRTALLERTAGRRASRK